MSKQYMFAVSFDPAVSQYRLESAQEWIGDPVFDDEVKNLRGLESDQEVLTYDGLEDILQMGLGHINKVLSDNNVMLDKGE